jgi:threonylcarbamoyladenosine tRNA methylthiotransferase MtaB
MSEPTYRVTTLGCRVNRADSLSLERDLAGRGYARAVPGTVPDIWIVNTCAVTAEGMRKSRKAVRRCAGSGARVIVTGCGVDMDSSQFTCQGVASVHPNAAKERLVEAVCGAGRAATLDVRWTPEDLVRVPVKVQDGCGRYCSYCVVPYLRPKPWSKSIREVLLEVDDLRELGAGEIILCGIDLGSYSDPETSAGLSALAGEVGERAGGIWVRLSSIELSDVDDELIGLIEERALRRHLHLPLQSGDAEVLARMGRKYTPAEYIERVSSIRAAVPEIAITSDIMVGFPGEDRVAFSGTRNLVEQLEFSRLHVFKYSRRPGTEAYDLGDTVSAAEKDYRASELRALAASTASRFHAGLVGRIIPVLVEGAMDSEPGMLFGRAESFAGAVFRGTPDLIGRVVELRVLASGPEGVRGDISGRQAGGDECVG